MRVFAISLFLMGWMAACSGSLPVKQEAYAKLSDHKTFEYDPPVVWKAIKTTLQEYKITGQDDTSLLTDWIYSQSRDKYVEYKVDGFPRKKSLMTRFRYRVEARKAMGGTDVTVHTEEQIERLKDDGSSAGFESMEDPDPSRAHDLIEKINEALLAAPGSPGESPAD